MPPICAKTGNPSDGYLRVEAPVHTRGSGALFLLVFLGPIGWIVLFLAMCFASETIRARVPMSATAVARQRHLSQGRMLSMIAGFAFLFPAIGRVGPVPAVWICFLVAAIVSSLVCHMRLELASVHISIDGSRRWITIARVHPAFARAVHDSASVNSAN